MQHTTTQPRITAIIQQSVFKKSTFVISFVTLGSLTILGGMVTLASAITLFSNTVLPELAGTILMDAVLDLMVGTLIMLSTRLFIRGQILAIWLFGGSILLDCLYSLIKGYPLHYVLIAFGALLIWQMLKFKKDWVLA